jgi:hypothetical protein
VKKPKLIELPERRSSPPHCCIVTGRRDGQIIDAGLPAAKARDVKNPHLYFRDVVVEEWAGLLGMVPAVEADELRRQLEVAELERDRLAAIVAGSEDLSAAEDKLREALGASQADPGDGKDTQ